MSQLAHYPKCPNRLEAWRSKVAHVPQSIFLTDASIAENIALGLPKNKINLSKLKLSAECAQIADFVESIPKKYETFVGERGMQLSGGQRQRIGIARALYKEASILVFDEATSALDNSTELAVMNAINSLKHGCTKLIIAHRLSTLSDCDRIIMLENGILKKILNSGEPEFNKLFD